MCSTVNSHELELAELCPLHHRTWIAQSQKELEAEEAVLDMDGAASSVQGGSRMLRDEVTPDDIASVVASWTGIQGGMGGDRGPFDGSPIVTLPLDLDAGLVGRQRLTSCSHTCGEYHISICKFRAYPQESLPVN